ncbi:hypothetical protein N9D31_00960 [Oligoflexaceae bacterium]|nr:hypothetical protein [Oligoflexaceae bacterium]
MLIDQSEGPYYDSWENLPERERQESIRQRLQEYIAFSEETTPFYKDRLSAFDPTSDNPLAKIPLLSASDLRENVPPGGTGLLSNNAQSFTVFQSGGTTGVPKTSLFTHDELEGLNLPNARGFYGCGLKKADRVANLFAVGGLYMTFVHINRMTQQYGCMNFPFSNQTPSDFIRTVADLFKINCFTGITSVVLSCLRDIYEMGCRDLQVDKIFYGGEHIYPADMEEMKRKFGTTTICAPGYGTVDTWYLGYQIEGAEHGVFHAHDDQVYLEIVDEDRVDGSGHPIHCKPGEVGMLYATAYCRRQTPVVRYRIGDKASWLKDPCPTGRTTPRFKLLGRGDDILRIGYDSIDYDFLQQLAAHFPELTATIQMEKVRVQGRDKLIVRIESEAGEDDRSNVSSAFQEKLLEERPSFRDFVKKGTIWPVEVEILDLNTLPTNPRTGKLIRVIDSI